MTAITESYETLSKMKVLGVLAKIKNQIKDRIDFAQPCIGCDEYQYSELRGSLLAFKEALDIIDEQIKELIKD